MKIERWIVLKAEIKWMKTHFVDILPEPADEYIGLVRSSSQSIQGNSSLFIETSFLFELKNSLSHFMAGWNLSKLGQIQLVYRWHTNWDQPPRCSLSGCHTPNTGLSLRLPYHPSSSQLARWTTESSWWAGQTGEAALLEFLSWLERYESWTVIRVM